MRREFYLSCCPGTRARAPTPNPVREKHGGRLVWKLQRDEVQAYWPIQESRNYIDKSSTLVRTVMDPGPQGNKRKEQ